MVSFTMPQIETGEAFSYVHAGFQRISLSGGQDVNVLKKNNWCG